MALPFYLAMTAGEFRGNPPPSRLAYMACHFSPYGTGLSNCPETLPVGSLLILNDRTPISGHDPVQIAGQLESFAEDFSLCGILLDFQRPGCEEAQVLADFLIAALPCPVIVSAPYATENAPVFLPPVPLDIPICEYLQPWQGQEIWLEAALDGLEITLTAQGAACTPLPFPQPHDGEFHDKDLHCHYHIRTEKDSARVQLRRTRTDVDTLLQEAESLGVAAAVGLWQEFG